MLLCELEPMEYAVTMEEAIIEDSYLFDDFFDYDIDEEPEEIEHKQPLYKLLTSQLDASISEINLTVFTDTEIQVYSGKANLYPYDYEAPVIDYHIYNIDNQVYIDAWCIFPKWRDIVVPDEFIQILYNEKSDIHNTPIGEMTTYEFNIWKKTL